MCGISKHMNLLRHIQRNKRPCLITPFNEYSNATHQKTSNQHAYQLSCVNGWTKKKTNVESHVPSGVIKKRFWFEAASNALVYTKNRTFSAFDAKGKEAHTSVSWRLSFIYKFLKRFLFE